MTGRPPEDVLRDVLEELAAEVPVAPDAYHDVRGRWLRRQRRRRRWGASLAVALVLAADGIGLWLLNDAQPETRVIFDDSPGRGEPAVRVGQP
jgi:hypothetical protein